MKLETLCKQKTFLTERIRDLISAYNEKKHKGVFKKAVNERFFFTNDYYLPPAQELPQIIDELNKQGFAVNIDRIDELYRQYSQEETDSYFELTQIFSKVGLNPAKRKDLMDYFFKVKGYEPYKMTKTGASLDAETLKFFVDRYNDEAAEVYLKTKQAHSIVNTLKNIKAAVKDGRLHITHNLNGAVSGRFTSSGDGSKVVAALPKPIRSIMVPSDEGTEIVSMDYKSMEIVVAANLAGEKVLLDDVLAGADLHQKVADALGIDRKTAKIVALGVGYGMSAFGLARRLGTTEEEAEDFIQRFWATRPKMASYKQWVIRCARELGYACTIGNIRRPSNDLTPDQCYNTVIQGSAADLFKRAIRNCAVYLKKTGSGKILNLVHDAIVFEIKIDGKEKTIKDLAYIMEHVHPKFILKVDVKENEW